MFAALAIALMSQTAIAALLIDFSESGTDLELRVSGSLDLTGMTGPTGGSTSTPRGDFYDGYSRFNSATSSNGYYFADGSFTYTGTAPGVFVTGIDPGFGVGFLDGSFDNIFVPAGTNSGQQIDISHTFTNMSFDDFSLTLGDEWGVLFPIFDGGGTATGSNQSITFRAIPEPTTAVLFGFTMTCAFFLRRRV